MSVSITYKNIWKVTYPIIVGSIAQNIINVVDTAFLGRLGEVAVGAAGNSIIFYFIFVIAGMGFAVGGEIMVGRRNGEKAYLDIGRIVDHCFYFLVPVSFLLFLVLKFASPYLLDALTESDHVYRAGMEYLDVRAFGIFFAFLNLGFRTFYIGITETRILSWSTSVMALVNVVLDYLLIFGNWGFPEMGIAGAALASVIAECSATLFFLIYTLKQIDLSKYNLLGFGRFDRQVFRKVLKISTPIMLQSFLALVSWMIFFLIIEKISERALAISHIIRSIYMVLMIPLFGFSAAVSTMVSNIIGQGQSDQVIKLVWRVSLLSIASTFAILQLNLFVPRQMIGVYTDDPLLIEACLPVLKVISLSMFFFAVAYILFSAVSGTGKTNVSLAIESITLVIYLYGTYLLGIKYELAIHWVWCSEFIYFGSMGVLAYLYLRLGNWKNANV